MTKLYTIIDSILERAQAGVVVAAGAGSCLLVMANALMRYVLKLDMYGSDEIIMLCAFWLYFMGSSLATREDGHLRADFLTGMMKTPRQLNMLAFAQHTITLIVSLIATYWAYKYIAWSFARHPKTPILKFPVIWMQFPILLSFVLSDLYILCHIVNDLRRLRRPVEEAP